MRTPSFPKWRVRFSSDTGREDRRRRWSKGNDRRLPACGQSSLVSAASELESAPTQPSVLESVRMNTRRPNSTSRSFCREDTSISATLFAKTASRLHRIRGRAWVRALHQSWRRSPPFLAQFQLAAHPSCPFAFSRLSIEERLCSPNCTNDFRARAHTRRQQTRECSREDTAGGR